MHPGTIALYPCVSASVLREALEVAVMDAASMFTMQQLDDLVRIEQERAAVTQAWLNHPNYPCLFARTRYDLEFSDVAELERRTGVRGEFKGTHYWFWSPVLEEPVLDFISSRQLDWDSGEPSDVKMKDRASILDVGAGNGCLIRKLIELGVKKEGLSGCDISSKAVHEIERLGVAGFCGRLEDMAKATQVTPGVIFLSYFIDRDQDQLATLNAAGSMLQPYGLLAIEGWFPCKLSDTAGLKYGSANVTKGQDAIEDIRLVVEVCKVHRAQLVGVVVGKRLVYSVDGMEILPSYTLIFHKSRYHFGSH